jgi:hypothetical protein
MMSPISKPIESPHPSDVIFGNKALSKKQQKLLEALPDFGSRITVKKNTVTMLDLSALTAQTGDEFAMFTLDGERLIVRGNAEHVPVSPAELSELAEAGYRWSGHTHPGFTDVDLIASQGDRDALASFTQEHSVIYNASGRNQPFSKKE